MPPTRFTPPLSDDFPTDGDVLVRLAEALWVVPEDGYKPLRLMEWQKDLFRRVLERYPDDHPDPEKAGRLRYKSVLVSLPRKQGKSLLGALMALYGMLMHDPAPEVFSVASNAEQARIVYKKFLYQTQSNPHLKKRMSRATDTRGIYLNNKEGSYRSVPAKASGLQGLHPSLVVFDELHVSKQDTWTAMNLGSATRRDGLVFGITTAGDDESELLIALYDNADRAIAGDEDLERFGAFIWEAPEGCDLMDEEALRQANPALEEGLLSLTNLRTELATMPENDARRYRLNQFVSSVSTWVPVNAWLECAGEWQQPERFVFSVDRTPDWSYASITAVGKVGDKTITSLVSTYNNINQDDLIREIEYLQRHNPDAWIMDGYGMRVVAGELKRRGMRVVTLTQQDVLQASALTFSKIVHRDLIHTNDPLVNHQVVRATRKNIGEGWRVSRKDSAIEIDACLGMVFGVYGIEITKKGEVQVF